VRVMVFGAGLVLLPAAMGKFIAGRWLPSWLRNSSHTDGRRHQVGQG
jgi:hypothetical protein